MQSGRSTCPVSLPVTNFPNYHVRSDGVIVGPKGPLKPNKNSRGYGNVSLVSWVDGKRTVKSHAVHRLVAEEFVPRQHPEQTEVNHKDGDKMHNHPDNLEWLTSTQNKKHATALGLYPTGELHHNWAGGRADHHRREAERTVIRNQYEKE